MRVKLNKWLTLWHVGWTALDTVLIIEWWYTVIKCMQSALTASFFVIVNKWNEPTILFQPGIKIKYWNSIHLGQDRHPIDFLSFVKCATVASYTLYSVLKLSQFMLTSSISANFTQFERKTIISQVREVSRVLCHAAPFPMWKDDGKVTFFIPNG